MKTRANLQRIQSLTYAINDEHAELLQDMNSQLQHLYDTIYQQLPNKEGLALRTNSSIRVSTIRRKVRKSRYSLNCSRLNTINPKKKSRPLGTSKRVGIRADRLRKAHQVLIKFNIHYCSAHCVHNIMYHIQHCTYTMSYTCRILIRAISK